ncbi:MAG: hypothetical protein AB8B50_10010 [Pirellulaceae bacterium]
MFDKNQIIDFVMQNPIVWILIPIPAAFLIYRRYRRTQRRLEHINDPQSKVMLFVGFVVTAILLAVFLMYF